MESDAPAVCGKIGFITDCEGNYEYWQASVALSDVVGWDSDGELAFINDPEKDGFVFGGDVFDKGTGDLRIAQQLLAFKRRHPERVWLLAGNRDINKLRLTAELAEEEIDVPQPVPVYPRAPPQVSLRSFLEKKQQEEGVRSLAEVNTRANRLRWILDHTMTAGGAFESRRRELALLAGVDEEAVDEEAVVQSFLKSVEEEGVVWEYLRESCLLVLVGPWLFVHGGIPKDALRWIPSHDMRYVAPEPGAEPGGSSLASDRLIDWVEAMNRFLHEGLQSHRAQPLFCHSETRARGGEALLVLTSTPACFRRSVVVESLLEGGMPTTLHPEVEEFLASDGVRAVFCGHKPCGDSPFVVRGEKVSFLHCDTTYSDPRAPDQRGRAVAAVTAVSSGESACVRIRGVGARAEDLTEIERELFKYQHLLGIHRVKVKARCTHSPLDCMRGQRYLLTEADVERAEESPQPKNEPQTLRPHSQTLRRCLCCFTLVLVSIFQALALDGLDSQILNVYWRSGSGAKAGGPAASPALSPSPSATVSATISPSAGDFGVLYVMLTHKKNYATKVAGAMSTWVRDVLSSEHDALLAVGDKESKNPPVISASPPCGNDHNDQLVCKAGIALQRAYETRGNFSWLFMVDDDFYLSVRHVHNVLSGFDASKLISARDRRSWRPRETTRPLRDFGRCSEEVITQPASLQVDHDVVKPAERHLGSIPAIESTPSEPSHKGKETEAKRGSRRLSKADGQGVALNATFHKISTSKTQELGELTGCRSQVQRLLQRDMTTNFMAFLILVDFVMTVVDIDARAVGPEASAPMWSFVISEAQGLALRRRKWQALQDKAVLFDLFTVLCGFVTTAVKVLDAWDWLNTMRILRVVRIMRVARIIRKTPSLRELQKLISMMSTCLKALGWSFVFCFGFMTVWGMLMVEFVHPILKELYDKEGYDFGGCQDCRQAASSVMRANLLLFKTVIAGDSWGQIAVPVIERSPATSIVFCGSLLTLVFGVLNMVVAVVVDGFAEGRQSDVLNLAQELEFEHTANKKNLGLIFDRLDVKNTGDLTLEDLVKGATTDAEFQSRLRVMDIDANDLEQFFGMIDADNSGSIEKEPAAKGSMRRDPGPTPVTPEEFIGPLSRWIHESKTATRFVKYNVDRVLDQQAELLKQSQQRFNLIDSQIHDLMQHFVQFSDRSGPSAGQLTNSEKCTNSETLAPLCHVESEWGIEQPKISKERIWRRPIEGVLSGEDDPHGRLERVKLPAVQ
eukprot:g20189.t2